VGGPFGRQVAFHLGDSHVHFLMGLKLGLTEHRPIIRPYDENQWLAAVDQLLAMYAWHGDHHVAHTTALRARHGR